MAVVEVIRTGRARDQILATCARNIWLLTYMFNVQLVVNHIPGLCNITADLLSRWQGSDVQYAQLHSLVPQHQWMPVHIDLTKLNQYIYISCANYTLYLQKLVEPLPHWLPGPCKGCILASDQLLGFSTPGCLGTSWHSWRGQIPTYLR